jgi:GT2 family glycosyltransferase
VATEIEVSVVLPNFNGRNLFEKNLHSLIDALDGIASEIIVVDDASTDDSVEYLKKEFPAIRVIVLEKNQGFSVACNAGINTAKGAYTCVSNTDVFFDKGYFSRVLSAFELHKCFAVKGRIINYGSDLNDELSIDSTTVLFEERGLLRFDKSGERHSRLLDFEQTNTFALLGCCFVAQTKQLNALGGFDEIYTPYYWEDSDLPMRAIQRGWNIYYDDEAIVWHEGGASINANRANWHRKLISNRNKFIFSWRFHDGYSFWLRHLFFIAESLLFRWIIFDWQYYAGLFLALNRSAGFSLRKRVDDLRSSKKCVYSTSFDGGGIKAEDIDAMFHRSAKVVYKERNELREIKTGSHELVIKSFRVPNFINRIVYVYFRKSKARRSYENSVLLVQLEVCCAQPYGFIEQFRWGLLSESYYASKVICSKLKMSEVLHGERSHDRGGVLKEFGEFVAMLHERGVNHKDLSPGNILIDESGSSNKFCLVDVNRMKFGLLTDEERFSNFKMLWASDQDLKVIMDSYAKSAGMVPSYAYARALYYSHKHKLHAERKEKIKRWLKLS